jgi:hypothetical protein
MRAGRNTGRKFVLPVKRRHATTKQTLLDPQRRNEEFLMFNKAQVDAFIVRQCAQTRWDRHERCSDSKTIT